MKSSVKKRGAALLLAVSLCLSLCAPAFAAEEPYFRDEAEITYPEAAKAVVRLGIMKGKESGHCFAPKDKVTRGEAAKYVALLLRGGEDITVSHDAATAAPAFPDIGGHWAEAYINYCAGKGVAFPQDDGNFDPNGLIGRYDLLRMVEAALGYNDGKYDLTGSYWIGSTDSIAFGCGLYDLLPELQPKSGDRLDNYPLTRDETAYILYGALSSPPYLGTEKRLEGDTLYFDKKYVLRPDGTPSTLLRETFGYDSWDDVPALPLLQQGEPLKPKTSAADPLALTDARDIQYWSAVAALTKLGVIRGRDDGSFDPAGNVTRAEAAKMITVIMNGGSDANTGAKKEPTFSDISGHWAEAYIEYCADMKIVSGDNNGRFDPDGNVSVVQFYKMALTALGYGAEAYALVGRSWASRTLECAKTTKGRKLTQGLPNDGLDGRGEDQPASREVAAQILYNALLANVIMIFPDRNAESDEVVWEFRLGDDTLLYQRFGVKEMPSLPPQPTV